MALADQIALVNTTTLYLVSPLAGTTTNGCDDHLEADANCAGFQNRWGHTTATAQNFLTQSC
jgi:hypothetical protein